MIIYYTKGDLSFIKEIDFDYIETGFGGAQSIHNLPVVYDVREKEHRDDLLDNYKGEEWLLANSSYEMDFFKDGEIICKAFLIETRIEEL